MIGDGFDNRLHEQSYCFPAQSTGDSQQNAFVSTCADIMYDPNLQGNTSLRKGLQGFAGMKSSMVQVSGRWVTVEEAQQLQSDEKLAQELQAEEEAPQHAAALPVVSHQALHQSVPKPTWHMVNMKSVLK